MIGFKLYCSWCPLFSVARAPETACGSVVNLDVQSTESWHLFEQVEKRLKFIKFDFFITFFITFFVYFYFVFPSTFQCKKRRALTTQKLIKQ